MSRCVVPGKHFPALTASEQQESYESTAVEYEETGEALKFPRFLLRPSMKMATEHYNSKFRPNVFKKASTAESSK